MTISTVSTTAAALALLLKAQGGDRILLAPGNYASLVASGLTIPGGVAIAAADPAKPPVVAGVELSKVDGVTLEGLDITISARILGAGNFINCKNVWLRNCRLYDPLKQHRSGPMFRYCTDSGIEGCDLGDFSTGLRVMQSQRVDVLKNSFHGMSADGVQGWESQFVTIKGNHFTDFQPGAGAHPDAIQFFTAGSTKPSTDLTIVDNVIVRGAGGASQGIFGSNEIKNRYARIVIRGNAVIGGMWNGIVWDGCDGIDVSGNLVQGYDEPSLGKTNMATAWIYLLNSTAITSADNRATFMKGAGVVANQNGNLIIPPTQPGNLATMLAWQAATSGAPAPVPAPPVPAPPPPKPAPPPIDWQARALTAEAEVVVKAAEVATVAGERDAALSSIKAAQAVMALVANDRDEDRTYLTAIKARALLNVEDATAALASYPPAA